LFSHQAFLALALLGLLLAWAAYVHVETSQEVNRFSDWIPPPHAETSSEPFVFVDPRDVLAFTLKPGVWKKQLVGAGRVPYLEELVELELALGAEEASHTYQVDVAVYFGLADGCELHVVGGEAYSLNRGHFVTVFPGVFHSAAHAGGRQRCKVLRAVHRSGAFAPFPKKEVEAKRLEDLSSVKTAHESPKLSKRVFIAHGEIPGLFQVSMSRFASGAECETHSHQSAAEVYVNFDGQGCHLEMKGVEAPGQLSIDLSGGKVAVVNPLTSHRAWNSAKTPCHNLNMLLGPPSE
jgi:quercetin dioxygenase-like cupin family protein